MKRTGFIFLVIAELILVTHPGWAQGRYPGERWERVRRAEDHGWSSAKLQLAKEYSQTINTDAVVIIHDGMILDDWGETTRRFKMHSARKSVLSALYGIYTHEGRIKLDKTLRELGIDDKEPSLTAAEKEATVRDLIKARSGVFYPGAYQGAVPSRPPRGSHAHGTYWFYSNWDFNVLGTIFEQETGTTIFQALVRRLAEPLQMEDFRLEDGYYFRGNESIHPAYPLRMTARDAARLGLLFLRNGRWRDQQIVPAEWVTESTIPYSDVGETEGYGYMWWVYKKGKRFDGGPPTPGPMYYASGAGGHQIFVIPFADLVVVHRVNTDITERRVETPQIDRLMRLILAAAPSPVDQSLVKTAREASDYKRPDLATLYAKAVQAALDAGGDPNTRDDDGRTALMFVATIPNTAIVESLIKAGADINARDEIYGKTALIYAAEAGNLEVLQVLLNAKADASAKTNLGQTALMEAAAKGQERALAALIQHKVDLNAKRRFGDTALMLAASAGHPSIVDALVKAGADVNAQDQDGLTALMIAARAGQTEITKALLAARANPNQTDRAGQTALIAAAGTGRIDTARLLIESGANVNAQTRSGQTPLMATAMRGRTIVAEALIRARADVNAKSRAGQTALMLAAMFGQADVVKALLAARADTHLKDNDGMTAMDRAVAEKQTETARLLGGLATNDK